MLSQLTTDSSQQRLYRQSVLARNSIYLSTETINEDSPGRPSLAILNSSNS